MLKRIKNRFLTAIREQTLDPNLFETDETGEGGSSFFVLLKGTKLGFLAMSSPHSYQSFKYTYTQFGPEYEETGLQPEGYWADEQDLIHAFEKWLSLHAREYIREQTVPDLWETVKQETAMMGGLSLSDVETGPFTPEEQQTVAIALEQLKGLIAQEFELTREEVAAVAERFDYVSEAATRLNKYDWKSLLVTTVVSLGIELALEPEKANRLAELTRLVFAGAIRLLQ